MATNQIVDQTKLRPIRWLKSLDHDANHLHQITSYLDQTYDLSDMNEINPGDDFQEERPDVDRDEKLINYMKGNKITSSDELRNGEEETSNSIVEAQEGAQNLDQAKSFNETTDSNDILRDQWSSSIAPDLRKVKEDKQTRGPQMDSHLYTTRLHDQVDRLTLLQDPDKAAGVRESRRELNNSEARLSPLVEAQVSSRQANDSRYGPPIRIEASARSKVELRRMSVETGELALIGLVCSVILLLLGLILFSLLDGRRRKGRRSVARDEPGIEEGGADGLWWGMCPKSCLLMRDREASDDNEVTEGGQVQDCSSTSRDLTAERVRLVAQEGASDRPQTHDSSIVILQRRLASSSLVVAARSTKPRVRLLRARVRRFIDDEAREMRNKHPQEASSKPRALGSRLYSYCLNSLASQGLARSEQAGDPDTFELKATQGARSEQNSDEHEIASSECPREEPPKETGHGKQMDASQRLAPTMATQPNPQKLTPSPIPIDACSSVSACSLFSASPIEGSIPLCGCRAAPSLLGQPRERMAPGCPLVMDSGRSKSHSPACRPDPVGNYQPCCSSVSPSAFNNLRQSPTGLGYPCQLQGNPPTINIPSKLASPQTDSVSGLPLPTIMDKNRTSSAASCNRIKRQYENYYDDERGDAYRRLTASIGFDFGFGFSHAENHEPAVCIGASGQSSGIGHRPHLDDLIQFCTHRPSIVAGQAHVDQALSIYNCSCHLPSQQVCYPMGPQSAQNSCGYPQFHRNWMQPGTGSAGELPTSDSASLGGSDSQLPFQGAAFSCSCQETPTQALPMGLVSFPPSNTLNEPSKSDKPIEPPIHKSHRSYLVGGSRGHRATLKGSAMWRHRRRQSPIWRRPFDERSAFSTRDHPFGSRNLRRMSIAGDQVRSSPVAERLTVAACDSNHVALGHRASIASDGSWPQQPSTEQLYRSPMVGGFGGQRTLNYDYYFQNSKSQYSSSNGSSSGIGFSGSTCTNTPTSAHQPYGGFSPKTGDLLNSDLSWPAVGHQSSVVCGYQLNQPAMRPSIDSVACIDDPPLKQEAHGQSGKLTVTQVISCPNRKFSLPVQLESQAAERLSPNKSRLLFEKNLQRMDSSCLSQANNDTTRAAQTTSAGQHPKLQQVDSRRSSQTITRQSSFWIEDKSADSILSLSTAGCLTAQPSEDLPAHPIDKPNQESNQEDCGQESSRPAGSQRPSLSSLMQSGDSIESVKQRLPTNGLGAGHNEAASHEQSAQDTPQRQDSSEAPSQSSQSSDQESRPNYNRKDSTDGKCRRAKYHSFYHHKSRLSSSFSNTSSTSSPSPDFGRRPSARILGLASRSGTISKRHPVSGCIFRSGRLLRFGGHSLEAARRLPKLMRQQHSAPAEIIANFVSKESLDTGNETKLDNELEQFDLNLTRFNLCLGEEGSQLRGADGRHPDPFELPATAKPEVNSASLERQCRDLWKLRATLHQDSCITDDWANYHKRLNRRYDSGYKSIENQLSSSIEGNAMLAAAANIQALRKESPNMVNSSEPRSVADERPQSGCSMAINQEKSNDNNPGEIVAHTDPEGDPILPSSGTKPESSQKLNILAQYPVNIDNPESSKPDACINSSRGIDDERISLLAASETQTTDRSDSRSSSSNSGNDDGERQ